MTIPNVLKLAGSGVAEVVGLAFDVQNNGNDGNDETVLHTYTIPANTLVRDGDSIAFEYWGDVATGTHNGVNLTLDGQNVAPIEAAAVATGGGWSLVGRLAAKDGNIRAAYTFLSGDAVVVATADISSLTFTNPLNLVLSGTGDDPAQVMCKAAFIAFWASALST